MQKKYFCWSSFHVKIAISYPILWKSSLKNRWKDLTLKVDFFYFKYFFFEFTKQHNPERSGRLRILMPLIVELTFFQQKNHQISAKAQILPSIVEQTKASLGTSYDTEEMVGVVRHLPSLYTFIHTKLNVAIGLTSKMKTFICFTLDKTFVFKIG